MSRTSVLEATAGFHLGSMLDALEPPRLTTNIGRQHHTYETLGGSHQWHEFPDAFRISQVTPQRVVSCNCSR